MVATSLLVLATEAGEEAGSIQLLPDFAELLWGLVGFALLMALMSKFAFPHLNRMLAERQAKIQGQLEEAESVRQQAEELRRQYEEQLGDARNRANEIVEEAKTDAERVRGEIVKRAEDEAAQILAKAREDVEADRGRFVSELRGQVAALSVELAGKIVQRELDATQHQALVDQYINELSGLN